MTYVIPRLPVALTIAGSDSGGGAGIQADLKTFSALGVFGTSAITAITAQNPQGVAAVQGVEPQLAAQQIAQVMDYFKVGAVKIGLLYSAEIIHAVAEALEQAIAQRNSGEEKLPVVVDPVMIATSGARLLKEDAVDALGKRIFPLASLITPNMDEAALLSGQQVNTDEHLASAAEEIYRRYGVPVLVKGGHLKGNDEAIDALYEGKAAEYFAAPYLLQVDSHGAGCTLSSAIAVYLMRGFPLADAISEGKNYLHQALANSLPTGKGDTLNHAFAPLPLEML
ncbi:MAG: bifunctional hydroxymethylpyrimidine kinase/phosphomethylpyrimidine kinase [SAR324 cluster bacterium]|nr:bifunctional hydroxymethylpyrimidine kinase/phosphomethylpyrimidine kinase [SAR324 cluster bacterium]MCZ6646422.1 bifunctional hydroxymethylpyrimidine kinase/phosphomethylpyrimidine kinase [SAR324 cluster bacterium]